MTDRYELEALRQSLARTRVRLLLLGAIVIALVAVAISLPGQW